jgi:hypothetical protein
MLTHGSDCQRAGSGPLDALVLFSVDQEGRRGIGTVPNCFKQRWYSTGRGAPSIKRATPVGESPPERDRRRVQSVTASFQPLGVASWADVQDALSRLPDTPVVRRLDLLPDRWQAARLAQAHPA